MNLAWDKRRIMTYINEHDIFLIVSATQTAALSVTLLIKRTDLLSSEMFLMNRDVFGGRMYLAMIYIKIKICNL